MGECRVVWIAFGRAGGALHIRFVLFFFSSRRRHTRLQGDWSSDVCSSDLGREKCWDPKYGDRSASGERQRANASAALPLSGKVSHLARGTAQFRDLCVERSEERRVGKECRSRWWPEQ